MNVAVTGSSGHLGQWVVAALLAAGHEVVCVARAPLERPSIAGLGWPRPVRTVAADLGGPGAADALSSGLAGVDAAVHLAAHVPADTALCTDADAEATVRANVLGTVALLRALGRAPRMSAVVYASTFEVYGAPLRVPLDEDHPTHPLGYYGATKLCGEKYLRLFGEDRGAACSSLRLPAIYGPGERIRRALGNFVRAGAEGRPLDVHGDGEDRRELVYAEDAARAVVCALDRRARGAFNIGSGRGFSIREMAEAVEQATAGVSRIVLRERVKPRLDYVLAIDRARAELGWEPTTSLGDGVRAQLAWERGRLSRA